MVRSLSNLVDNLAERIHKIKCNDCDYFLEYKSAMIIQTIERFSKKLDEELKNTFKFSNNDINKFISLLRKCVYPYKYMDYWDKFN